MACTWHDNVLHIQGEFDMSNTAELRDAIDIGIASPQSELRLDMALVGFCGSSCVACLVRALQAGKQIRIVAASPIVRRILDISGLELRDDVIIED